MDYVPPFLAFMLTALWPNPQNAAADVENAIQEMERQDVHSYILDLRNNPVVPRLILE